ncbi:G/T mismatches repair enzyme [uncultured archaeon]|nr:G/T mismatches repair enzyme [uncultured archaeon]
MRKKAKGKPGPPAPSSLAALHAWYSKNARALPWRESNANPYHVLVSEFLLQQTQVKQAIPYYERFIKKFPTLSSLASADLDSVLKAWEGCGYYARARNLHKTAQIIMKQYDGKIPSSHAALLSLPGIGPYLAASISSIAYQQPHAVLDGNVIRVLARASAYPHAVDSPKSKKELQKMAQDWLDQSPAVSPSLHNQSMMELGALICTPRNPKCASCPLAGICRAHLVGREEDFPIKARRQARPLIQVGTGFLFNQKGEILISQRYGDDFLGGLWEFPGGKQEEGESLARCVEREFMEEVGLPIRARDELMVVRAEYTHKSVDMHVFRCVLQKNASSLPRPLECQAVKWEKISNLGKYAFPKANRRMLEWLEKGVPR